MEETKGSQASGSSRTPQKDGEAGDLASRGGTKRRRIALACASCRNRKTRVRSRVYYRFHFNWPFLGAHTEWRMPIVRRSTTKMYPVY